MSYRHVAIIIPIYNELDNILTLIDLLLMEVPGANIFIVDDNSPDGSALAIEKCQSLSLVYRRWGWFKNFFVNSNGGTFPMLVCSLS